jgi:PAS domain S-box-containing protein
MTAQLEQDVAERERHIEEITALTNANETIFQSIATAMITTDDRLRVERVNNAASRLFGVDEHAVRGRAIAELESLELAPHLEEIARTVQSGGEPVQGRMQRAGGRVYQIGAFPLRAIAGSQQPASGGCLVLVEDVTEKVSLEERMVRAEKLSSLAILTAGMAHEINNPLSSITTNAQNIASETEDPEQKQAIDYIQQETRRIRDIVGRLLEFAGKNGDGHRSADVNAEARLVVETVRYSIPSDSDVRLETGFTDDLPQAAVPADELRQILLNIVTNAFQATTGTGGVVRVSSCLDGDGLRLIVEDNGVGIPEETQQRIFDPFFTTKADGSGLGLSVVYGLLSKYGGSCRIQSTEGRGTTVRLELPQRSDGDV